MASDNERAENLKTYQDRMSKWLRLIRWHARQINSGDLTSEQSIRHEKSIDGLKDTIEALLYEAEEHGISAEEVEDGADWSADDLERVDGKPRKPAPVKVSDKKTLNEWQTAIEAAYNEMARVSAEFGEAMKEKEWPDVGVEAGRVNEAASHINDMYAIAASQGFTPKMIHPPDDEDIEDDTSLEVIETGAVNTVERFRKVAWGKQCMVLPAGQEHAPEGQRIHVAAEYEDLLYLIERGGSAFYQKRRIGSYVGDPDPFQVVLFDFRPSHRAAVSLYSGGEVRVV